MNHDTDAATETLRQAILSTVDILETVVHELVKTLGKPYVVDHGNGFDFKYAEHSPEVVSVLKSVRIVSSLDAICVLLESGHTSEAAALLRGVSDFSTEIQFLFERNSDGSLPTRQQQFVDEFFAQEMPTPEVLAAGLRKPNMVPKKKIHAVVARQFEKMADETSETSDL